MLEVLTQQVIHLAMHRNQGTQQRRTAKAVHTCFTVHPSKRFN